MSAIAGILIRDRSPDPEQVLVRMLGAVPHRGSAHEWVTTGAAWVGVARSDDPHDVTSVAAAQGVIVAVRGEIDNVADVRRRFDPDGADGPGRTVADTLAKAFRDVGPELFPQLRGVFSLVVSDGQRIWGLRDQVGYHPLYVRADPAAVYLGSEAKQIVAGAEIPYEPDLDVVEMGYFHRMGDDRRCAIRGVQRVGQAHVVEANDRSVRARRYWDPEPLLETGPRYSATDLKDRFDELMTQALDRSLRGKDVVSLSGGVDSPALAAYAAPLYLARFGSPLPALSTVYPNDPSVDETPYIEAVADALGLPLHTYESVARPTDGLERWVRLLDAPVPVVSLAETEEHLSKARSLGHRSLLSGEMAEFVFDSRYDLIDYLIARGRLRAAASHLRVKGKSARSTGTVLRLAVRSIAPAPVLGAWRSIRNGHRRVGGPTWVERERLATYPVLSGRATWRENQVVALRGPTVGMEADDLLQALTGVATRRPWADIDLWEFFLRLSADQKHPPSRGTKALVRSLLRGRVPDVILDRGDKTVFDAAIISRVDFPFLERWLIDPEHRLPGVDYADVGNRLRSRQVNILDFMWMKDLASVHIFLSQF